MAGGVVSTILNRITVFLFGLFVAFAALSEQSVAQGSGPTVIDFWTKSDTLFLELSLNAEALLAGIDPAAPADTAQYRNLRRLVSSELEPQIREFVLPWMQTLQVDAAGPVALSYEGVRIPVVGDPTQPRVSKLLLTGALPNRAASLRLHWPEGFGPAVLRQQNVSAPYTAFLAAGETSPLIPLYGGASLSVEQTLRVFFAEGVTRVFPNGPKLILLALTLVFLSLRVRPVLTQLVTLSLGVLVGLGLAVYDVATLPLVIDAQTFTAAIVVLALWNLIWRRLQIWRVLAVLAVGLFAGFVLAQSLAAVGVPPDHLPPAILGYWAGVAGAIIAIAVGIFAVASLISGNSHRLRGRISVLASMLIAGVGIYWIVKPLLFA